MVAPRPRTVLLVLTALTLCGCPNRRPLSVDEDRARAQAQARAEASPTPAPAAPRAPGSDGQDTRSAEERASVFGGNEAMMTRWNAAAIPWYDYESGLALARETGRPALAIVHASWCSACERYSRVFRNEEVLSLSERFVMISIDATGNRDVADQLTPDGTYVPRTFILDAEGQPDARFQSSRQDYHYFLNTNSPSELLALMRRALSS